MNPLRLLLKEPDRRFLEEADAQGLGLAKRLHGYLYLRWPYTYIRLLSGEHPLVTFLARGSRWLDRLFPARVERRRKARKTARTKIGIRFADTYHGKVMPTAEATRLVTIGREVSVTEPETVIPYALARDIVLKNPDHIVVFDCPCRAMRENPCLPMDVCLVVGEPFASMVLAHHKTRHARRVTPDEAVDILKAENARGHVHHAFFKDVVLGRFYAICNCCSCCCAAMAAQRNGVGMLAPSGYLVHVDADACVGCGNCVQYCQFGALKARDRTLQIKTARCMGCGACVNKCPKGALSLIPDATRTLPLLVDELLNGCTTRKS
ncbi:4Fe-4S dicluster domain-containing protein [Humidesulfovibrio mexicanus]|uniref:4Fe-4S dicluster domain-containing protein n=1 Tax=Humidesulfovibrio mexicanus TaxID=147047 RepID=A0A238Z1X6_9BACT|nr:4Fe-4S binding protein [Humidesulfovibrio mexicanus]SNR77376.1 4Fe-4S dicluster domain-containing protein [Humidesulfovibrio mexicanus]